MRTILSFAIAMSVAALFARSGFAQNVLTRPTSIEGLDPSAVQNVLGLPHRVITTDGPTVWEYDSPRGSVEVSFVDGKAVLNRNSRAHAHAPLPDDTEVLYRWGVSNAKDGNLHDARLVLAKCASLNPRHRKCSQLLNEVTTRYSWELNSRYGQLARTSEFAARRDTLQQMLEVEPNSASLQGEMARVENALLQTSREAIESLVSALDAIDVANRQMARGEYAAAAKTLAPFDDFGRVTSVMNLLRGNASAAAETEAEQATTFADIDRLMQRFDSDDLLTGSASRRPWDALAHRLAALLAEQRAGLSAPERTRLFVERLRSQFPNAARLPIDWAKVGIAEPTVSVVIDVSLSRDCGERLASENASGKIASALGTDVRVTDNAPLHVSVNVSCTEETIAGPRNTITSTFVASHQQVVNPDYIKAQQEVVDAQKALDDYEASVRRSTTSTTLGAVLSGVGEGLALNAINRAKAHLNNTPPFLSEPVKSPYTATKYTLTRVARLTADVSVNNTDNADHGTDAISRSRESAGEVTEGILSSDSEGLTNRSPALKSADFLWSDALNDAIAEIAQTIRTEIATTLIERARAEKDLADTVGLLLLRRDLSGDAPPAILETKDLERLRRIPLTKTERLKLTGLSLHFPPQVTTAKTLHSDTVRAHTTRGTAIQKALDAVVTVQTERSLGTGFFVSSKGLLVTNAHVISGASKVTVRCRDGSIFLASVVRSMPSPDLALLKINGPVPAILAFGDSDQVEVGSEVIAVGTPRGLEGTVTRGIVSANRIIDGIRFFQVDAAVNPGNSGGPLLDARGSVIGVTTLKENEAEGLGFGIAASEFKKVFGSYLN